MSIDLYYKFNVGKKLTKALLDESLSGDYDIINIQANKDGVVKYFSVNPKDKKLVIYEKGYEFHLQDDGRYWHPILTRDDTQFETENNLLTLLSIRLGFDLETE